uniref:Uncharacterized protein n=1 Tax=Anguilla anguilla TaxID=7936 RepID=A0A0E9UAI3_ANGAN
MLFISAHLFSSTDVFVSHGA